MIPLKLILVSWHLPEMPTECQTVQIWLPLTALTLRWHCADFNCLLSCPWWCHRKRCDPCDTKSESEIPNNLLTPWLRSLRNFVLIRAAKYSADAVILVNNSSTLIFRAPHNAALCKPLYECSDSFTWERRSLYWDGAMVSYNTSCDGIRVVLSPRRLPDLIKIRWHLRIRVYSRSCDDMFFQPSASLTPWLII